MLSLKRSLTEHPARPEDAQAHAHAHEDAQAQEDAHEEAHDEAQEDRCEPPERWEDPPERGRLTGTLMTLTRMYVSGELP